MSVLGDSDLNQTLASFLAGDARAGAVVFAKTEKPILNAARARAPDLCNDLDDIVNEVFVLMMEAPTRFDPSRGSALSYIKAVLMPEAIRRVRAKSARPGSKTRREVVKAARVQTFPVLDPVPDSESVPSAGYGSPEAMEAAADAHVLWSRAAPPVRLIIGGLIDGKTQVEIAAEADVDRFKVTRTIKLLRRQLSDAA
jgi:RNA polymerase sigma-70 factor (ECF subfamily)